MVDSRLNVEVVWSPKHVENWLEREAELQLGSKNLPPEQIDAVTQASLAKFQRDLARTQRILRSNPLVGRIQPAMLCIDGYQFIYLLLKTHLEEYFLDQPEDLEIREKWKDFCLNFARLRYKRDSSVFGQVNDFLQEILEKLKLYRMNDQQSLEEVEIINIFRELCQHPDLLDLDLGLLFDQGTPLSGGSKKMTLSVTDLQQTYYLLAREIKENFSWLIDVCEERISPCYIVLNLFKLNGSPHTIQTHFMNGFQTLRDLVSVLDAIQVNSLGDILKNKAHFDKIKKTFIALFYTDGTRVFGDLQYTIQEIFSDPNTLDSMLTPSVLQSPSIKQQTLDCTYSAFIDANDAHIILEAYLLKFWEQLHELTISSLRTWSEKVQKSFFKGRDKTGYPKFLQSIPRVMETTQFLIPKPAASVPSSSREIDIDATLAFIQGTSHQNKNNKQPRGRKGKPIPSKQSVTKATPRKIQPPSVTEALLPTSVETQFVCSLEEFLHPSSSVSIEEPVDKTGVSEEFAKEATFTVSAEPLPAPLAETSQPSLSVFLEDQIIETLLQKILEQPLDKTPYLKSSLEQVELAFSSLVTAYQKMRLMAPEDFESYDYHLMISNMYYLIEQVLRYKNIERDSSSGDFSHHVLRRLRDLGQFDAPINEIVKKLYSANLWTLYTETQMTSRLRIDLMNQFQQKLVIPPILLKLHRISHASTPELCLELKSEIEILYQETLAFVKSHIPPEIKEGLSLKLSTRTCKVTLEKTSELQKMVALFQKKLSTVISQQVFQSEVNDTLEQGNKSLSFLKRTLKELSSPELTLQEFSPLLRSTIHLTNHICESIFRALFTIKYHVDTWEHRLSHLIKVSLNSCPTEMRRFFHTHFKGINTDSRYPFDLGKIRSTLHGQILEAESLRKNSNLEENSVLATDRIWAETSVILSRALNFVSELALPRLRSTFPEASSSHSR